MISATSFTLVGVVNKFLTVLLNVVVWDKHSSFYGVLSVCLCLFAGSFYQQSPLRSNNNNSNNNTGNNSSSNESGRSTSSTVLCSPTTGSSVRSNTGEIELMNGKSRNNNKDDTAMDSDIDSDMDSDTQPLINK